MNRTAVSALLALVLATVAGCRRPPPPPRGYFGPTETMAAVVERINQNNSAIPTLRAAGNFEADVVDQGKRHFVNGDITLLYRRPGEVRLVGKKDIAGQIFEAGSNAEQYWLIVKADTDTMWYGDLKNLDRVDPGDLPIRPDVLIEVLGIDQISTNFREPPAPTMRFNNDEDVYMLNFNVALPDRWAVRKEVWYDRPTLLPRLVLLFDENGRIVVRAYLARARAVEGSAGRVAGEYRIYFPDNGTSIRLDLDDTALTRNNAPNERSFTFPTNPGVSRQINLDEPARP